MMNTTGCDQKVLEYLRIQSKQRFDPIRGTWLECGRWALPHSVRWLTSEEDGRRNNQHIVDGTHVLGLRSFVAGFLEGNTSATRPWARWGTGDEELDRSPKAHLWLDKLGRKIFNVLASSNFYHAAGEFYYHFGTYNTGSHYIDEMKDGRLFFHTLAPGSYFILNNGYGEAVTMVREFQLTVKALVDTYGVTKGGKADWSNFSPRVKQMYERGNYTQKIDVVHVIRENSAWNPEGIQGGVNRKWASYTYELGGQSGQGYADGQDSGINPDVKVEDQVYLKISYSKRKPFIVGRSYSTNNYEYGEMGPTTSALGMVKSLNKKAIIKDQALEQMVRPTMQGPASVKKSYITSAPNNFIPLDPTAMAQKGVTPVFQINPAIGALLQDQTDLRGMVDKFYYADYLLYLSRNPKTRTATETNAILSEQQLIIGPNLQSLSYTYNVPVMEFVADYVLDNGLIEEPPEELAGKWLRPQFISVFAQAQKAADLPNIDRYIQMITEVGAINPAIFDKANLDRLADLYEDRLYLPAGLNNPQNEVDAKREQARAQAQRQQQLTETIPALAGAAKDVGLKLAQ